MKITFQAFRWDCQCSELTLSTFISYLMSMNGERMNNRIFYFVQDNDGFYKGVVLTIKDFKKFTKIVHSNGLLTLDIHTLNQDEQIADFNFFIINSNNSYGMYQYYYQSCSLNNFNVLIKKLYNKYKNELLYSKETELKNKGLTDKQIKMSLKNFNKAFKYAIIERGGSFIDRISKLREAHDAEIEFDLCDITDDKFVAIKQQTKRIKYKLIFEKTTFQSRIIDNLIELLNKYSVKKARISGVDENVNDTIYKTLNDFDSFACFDYDSLVSEINLNEKEIEASIKQNKTINELILTYNKIAPIITK